MSKIPIGFDPNTIRVPLDNLLPSRKIAIGLLQSKKYQQILASIREVGVIEPLSVIAADAAAGTYLLLDGHVRIVAMRELGYTEANCLIAKDDEAEVPATPLRPERAPFAPTSARKISEARVPNK